MGQRYLIADGARAELEKMHPGKTLEEILMRPPHNPCDCSECVKWRKAREPTPEGMLR